MAGQLRHLLRGRVATTFALALAATFAATPAIVPTSASLATALATVMWRAALATALAIAEAAATTTSAPASKAAAAAASLVAAALLPKGHFWGLAWDRTPGTKGGGRAVGERATRAWSGSGAASRTLTGTLTCAATRLLPRPFGVCVGER